MITLNIRECVENYAISVSKMRISAIWFANYPTDYSLVTIFSHFPKGI